MFFRDCSTCLRCSAIAASIVAFSSAKSLRRWRITSRLRDHIRDVSRFCSIWAYRDCFSIALRDSSTAALRSAFAFRITTCSSAKSLRRWRIKSRLRDHIRDVARLSAICWKRACFSISLRDRSTSLLRSWLALRINAVSSDACLALALDSLSSDIRRLAYALSMAPRRRSVSRRCLI